MKFTTEELNLLLDGTQDTLHRLKHDEKVNEDYETYTNKVIALKSRIEKELNGRN